MPVFASLVARDLSLGLARSGARLLPVIFFVVVAILFPFAVGPDTRLLARIAGGVLWVAALLAALLPVDALFEGDRADGTLDQYVARGLALETVAAARLVSHWLGFGPPLLIAAPLGAVLLGLPGDALGPLLLGLLLGTPALASLGIIAAALTAGLRGAGGLVGLLVLPLAVPVLIFGAGMLAPGADPGAAVKLLAAASLVLVALGPFAAGAALRAALE
jgi:heme exporter protein B